MQICMWTYLDVSVHDPVGVQVVQGQQEGVQHHLDGLPFVKPAAVLVQQPVQITPFGVLLHQHDITALLQEEYEETGARGIRRQVVQGLPGMHVGQECTQAYAPSRHMAELRLQGVAVGR